MQKSENLIGHLCDFLQGKWNKNILTCFLGTWSSAVRIVSWNEKESNDLLHFLFEKVISVQDS